MKYYSIISITNKREVLYIVKKEEIELSPIEATAYWWINLIRYKVREITISGAVDKSEVEFAEIFYSYTEMDWRKVYLEINKMYI